MHLRRVPALDGLRGVAVLAVVAYHLGYGWARGGYLGVDTFLVLSGYLITSGLLAVHDADGRIALVRFWARRARRLLPALVVVLAAAAAYAATAALPDEAHALRLDALSALGFVSNWRFVVTGQGYFGHAAAPSLLRHTWSLGVEAQLYVLWPLILIPVLSRWGRRAAALVAFGLAAASTAAAVSLGAGATDITRAYYGTDTRAASFLVGAGLAAALTTGWRRTPSGDRHPLAAGAAGAGGAVATLWLWATLGGASRWLFRGGLALAIVATGAVIVALATSPEGTGGRALSWAPLRQLGRVSYGIYLWHWPLILLLTERRTGLSGPALLALRLLAIAAATVVSWLLIERPILAGGPRWLRRSWQPPVALATGALLVVALAVPAASSSSPGGRVPAAGGPSTPALVLGDSVAVTLANGMRAPASSAGLALHNGAIVGCGIAVGRAVRSVGQVGDVPPPCLLWEQTWRASIEEVRPAVTVILVGRWELLDRQLDGRWQHIGQPAFDQYLSTQLDRAIAIAASGGGAVVLCTVPYFQGAERPEGGIWPENDPARADRFNVLVRAALARHPSVVAFDLNALVSPHGRFASVIDGRAIRSDDGVHFSPDGGAFVATRLLPVLLAAAGRSA